MMYEMARARIAEQEQAARKAGEARRLRAEARAARRKSRQAEPVVPAIPEYADDLLDVAQNTVPAPREETAAQANGRPARSAR